MSECDRCRGTGWANAARDSGMEDMPLMLRPIGVYQCPRCGGRGDTDIFARMDTAQRTELAEAVREAWNKLELKEKS